ncbi:hypothetical protein I0C86_15250 [Plantactinospora sp. S1510]|uniref:Uncharacterized protein n=1 Tax=Plantactinospora alkalitolerans TaxID=2789879 RepID=A0ABS0GVT5_9ACTN|nr:hypothetical protein [Plantactinospora alkalitolerans]MBF9130301.1 hypothetical protein [Plantactinospora alkalitolerans]
MAEHFAPMVKMRQMLSKIASQGREQRESLLGPVPGLNLGTAGAHAAQAVEPAQRHTPE